MSVFSAFGRGDSIVNLLSRMRDDRLIWYVRRRLNMRNPVERGIIAWIDHVHHDLGQFLVSSEKMLCKLTSC